MPQLTIYLDEDTRNKVQLAAQQACLSQSKWVAKLIQEKVTINWSDYVSALAGAWKDFPTVEELRRDSGQDITREKF